MKIVGWTPSSDRSDEGVQPTRPARTDAERFWLELERYCQQREFTFQAIDLRWGVPAEAGLDHRTMRICFEELRRSQDTSPEPNFLILLGNRYGWRPLPEVISVEEFEKLKTAAQALVRNHVSNSCQHDAPVSGSGSDHSPARRANVSESQRSDLGPAPQQIQSEPPVPAKQAALLKNAVAILEDWYLLDENAKPFGEEFPIGEYVLRTRKTLLHGVDYGR